MKKLCILLSAVFLFASCGSAPAPEPEPIPEPEPVAEAPQKEPEPEPVPEPEPEPVVEEPVAVEPEPPVPERGYYREAIPEGSWIDWRWNADWDFEVESLTLFDAITGQQYYDFTDDKITNLKVTQTEKGVTLSFDCAETHRWYAFTKFYDVDDSLLLEIQRDWVKELYRTQLPYREPRKR